MKLTKASGLFLAAALLMMGNINRVLAQDAQATPQGTGSTDASTAPAAKGPGTKEQLKALDEKNQELEIRLKALEDQMAAQKAAPPAAGAPASTPGPMDQVGPGTGSSESTAGLGSGVHDVNIPFESGDEVMYSESRYLSFSNRAGDTEFRIGGYEWADLDINNQSYTLNGAVTNYSYLNNPANNTNGFEERKAHLDFRATIDKFVGAAIGIESDKSTGVSLGLYHAYIYAKFDKAFNFEAGKISNPLSLEGDQPSADLPFVEASMLADLTVNKDIGAMIEGKVNHAFEYALEISNGQQDNESSATGPGKATGDFKNLTGRIFFTPWEKSDDEGLQGLGFGGGGSIDNETNEDTAVWAKMETAIGGNPFMAYNGITPNGDFYHLDFQGYYYNGSFGFLGEHVDSIQSVSEGASGVPVQLDNVAWLAEAQWVIGGKAGFEGAEVDNPFDPAKGHWGALEFVARMDQVSTDVRSFAKGFAYAPAAPMAAGYQVATAYGVGFNWWLNDNFKFMCDGEETDFSGGAGTPPAGPQSREQILVSRVAFIM